MLIDYMQPNSYAIDKFAQESFSQFGEDIILFAWLETLNLISVESAFFLDIGAHHPSKGSNTKLLRKHLGWKGVHVEPDPKLIEAFNIEASECINLNVAVGSERGHATLSIFDQPALNTLSESTLSHHLEKSRLVASIQVKVVTINDILTEHLTPKDRFTFLNVDAEGLDYDIIKSMDFVTYRPDLIFIEDFEFDLSNHRSSIFYFLTSKGYKPVSHCMVSTLYRKL